MAKNKTIKDPIPVSLDGVTQGRYGSYSVNSIPATTDSPYEAKLTKALTKRESAGNFKNPVGNYVKKYEKAAANPGKFKSNWKSYVDKYGKLLDTEYDPNSDASYLAYKNQYIRGGQKAMQDTLAQAAALTGGYGSSYGQSAAQQTYNDYMAQLADKIPELAQAAQDMYMNKLNAYSGLYGQDFDIYNANRNYNLSALDSFRNLTNMYYDIYQGNLGNLDSLINIYSGLNSDYYNRANTEYGQWSDAISSLQAAAEAAAKASGGSGGSGRSGSNKKTSDDESDLITELRYANKKGASPYDMWAYVNDPEGGGISKGSQLIKQTSNYNNQSGTIRDPAALIQEIVRANAKRKK